MTMSFLPGPDWRCTAWWYAQRAGMLPYGGPSGPADREFLLELGRAAARLARWHGIPEWKTMEGELLVHQWPEHIWSSAADALGQQAAVQVGCAPVSPVRQCRHSGDPAWESADGDPAGYGDPPGPMRQYQAQLEPPDDFWSCPAPPEDTQAYVDWTQMAASVDAGWGEWAVPWDGDDIRDR